MTRLTTERARLFADRPYVPCCDDRECVERQAERDVHDLAREVLALTSERDAAQHAADALRTALDGLRAAVATVRDARAVVAATAGRCSAAWDAVEALPTASQTEGIAVALRASYEAGDALNAALDALLAGAPLPATVPAALVRRQVGVVLAANGCDCDCGHSSDEHDDDCDRCLACRVEGALDAALGRCV